MEVTKIAIHSDAQVTKFLKEATCEKVESKIKDAHLLLMYD